ncbi:MAG: topoisomerase IV [Ruminococcaceae bacterium]|nr:topoisomerase IV [Oscillospiraceae bacterium]
MAKKTTKDKKAVEKIEYAPIRPQLITDTIEKNYMPYVMSVIISRAIPEIDGFKPAHRKLLYTMYKMGLLTGGRTKSTNVVGRTLTLNPHGDAAVYETMVRLTRGYEALLHPFIDSKGSFGKQYSSDMKYAASRYTEVKLDTFCNELFSGISKDAVDMVDNYDGTLKEPVLFPTTFPNVLVTPNMGIAVGMASNICSFNLAEICDGTIALLKKPNLPVEKLMEIIKAPDFSGGGQIIYDAEQFKNIYTTGQGSFRIRSRYSYDKANNCIDILQIPYSTTIEQIMDKIAELVKSGKVKEITDFRDEIDLSGFKLTIDIRKGTDPDKLMARLFKLTPLEDSFKCNFNVLIDGAPRTLGIAELLNEWIRFRTVCVRRELTYELGEKKDQLHLLLALGKILLDIDKAIRIIRRTEKEEQVIPNLMEGFTIDEIQAEYIANIKLRNLNRQYILNKISEIEDLKKEIEHLEELLGDEFKIKAYIANQLNDIKKKYGQPRKSQIIHVDNVPVFEEPKVESYPVYLVLSKEGYLKKITMRSLQGNDEQKFKDGDSLLAAFNADNADELTFFTDKCKVFKCKVDDVETTKASLLGDFIPAKLGMDPGEKPMYVTTQTRYPAGTNMVFIFENGKGVRVPVTAYETKAVRRKLTSAYSDASPVVAILDDTDKKPRDIMLISSDSRAIVIKTALIPQKNTRTSSGVTLMTLKKGQTLTAVQVDVEDSKGYKKTKIPATGVPLVGEQLRID